MFSLTNTSTYPMSLLSKLHNKEYQIKVKGRIKHETAGIVGGIWTIDPSAIEAVFFRGEKAEEAHGFLLESGTFIEVDSVDKVML